MSIKSAAASASAAHSELWKSAARAAVNYAKHGWPVIPGSYWNGSMYKMPWSNQSASGLRPVWRWHRASSDPAIVRVWWSAGNEPPPSVFLRAGLAFDVLSVCDRMAARIVQSSTFRSRPTPVMVHSDTRRMFFLTTLGEIPADGFPGAPGDVVLVRSGTLFPAPPSRIHDDAVVEWIVRPAQTKWRLVTFVEFHSLIHLAVQDLLTPASQEAEGVTAAKTHCLSFAIQGHSLQECHYE